VLAIGPPGIGKSHAAKAIALLALQRGDKVFYREARDLIEELTQARELGDLRKYRAQLYTADLLIIDDLFIRKLPVHAAGRTRPCADGSL
jgi:DNA replication protein DnaC